MLAMPERAKVFAQSRRAAAMPTLLNLVSGNHPVFSKNVTVPLSAYDFYDFSTIMGSPDDLLNLVRTSTLYGDRY